MDVLARVTPRVGRVWYVVRDMVQNFELPLLNLNCIHYPEVQVEKHFCLRATYIHKDSARKCFLKFKWGIVENQVFKR